MQSVGKMNVDQIMINVAKLVEYHMLNENEHWKAFFIKKITDMKFGRMDIETISREKFEELVTLVYHLKKLFLHLLFSCSFL